MPRISIRTCQHLFIELKHEFLGAKYSGDPVPPLYTFPKTFISQSFKILKCKLDKE